MSPSPQQTQNMSTVSSPSYMKLRFFSRIRRFIQSKSPRKRHNDQLTNHRNILDKPSTLRNSNHDQREEPEAVLSIVKDPENHVQSATGEEEEEDDSVLLQKSVKRLHFGSWEEQQMAAKQIERLAKEDVKIRKRMAELGVIHMLVSMLSTEVVGRRRAALKALIELSNGTYRNKALMVEAGILTKLPKNVEAVDESTRHNFGELLLSLSSLANTHIPIASSEILPFTVAVLESGSSSVQTKEVCIGTLYNLSAVLENAGPLVSNGVVHTILKLSSVKELSEKSLAILGNLVVTLMGKKAMEDSPLVPESLIEIMTWEDETKCQELSAYILMILAHQSSEQREKMAKSGIVHVILQVALLGSPLAQRRALKLLQWFKDERQAKMGPHSGPQTGRVSIGSPVNPREAQEGKMMMRNLVKQSLHKNLEMITKRAAHSAVDSSKLKPLVISTSSKSLPY